MFKEALLELVYPSSLYCVCCSKIIDDSRPYKLCNDCMSGLKWAVERTCCKCGKPLSDSNPLDTCFSCREHAHKFRKGYTVAEYGTHERSLIFALKYHSRTDIASTIGEMMYDRMQSEFGSVQLRNSYDLIVPVPMYEPKKLSRGYNQAELIAREFAKRSLIDYHGDIMTRTRETSAMRGLSPDRRRAEIEGVFAIKKGLASLVQGSRVIVIDDIYTTGATSDEMARTLYGAGAETVDILSFAAGADMVK